MKHYRQLTLEQRFRIHSCLNANFTLMETARIIGVHKSTVGRELARNGSLGNYRPELAQRLLQQRREQHPGRRGKQGGGHQ